MTVLFYSGFYKRKNSTKQPSGGTGFNVVLKDETSMMKPAFLVSTVDWAWNYAKWGSRFYYITDIVQESNYMFRVECELDELATFKADIGAYTTLVSRSASDEDLKVADSIYPAKCDPETWRAPYAVNTIYTDNISAGTYLMATVGKSGNHFYVMSASRFASVCYWLFPTLGMDFGQWVLMSAGQALAGGNENILKNVVALKWLPIQYSALSAYLTSTTETYIGNWTMPHANSEVAGDSNIPLFSDYPLVFTDRSDGGARGEWLYQSPFAQYSVYIPPFGKIEIDGTYLKHSDMTVYASVALNLISGNVCLRLNYKNGPTIGVYNANLACDMSSGGTTYNFGGVAQGIASAVASYATEQYGGMVGGIASAVSSSVPSGSQIGGGVSGIAPDLLSPMNAKATYFTPIEENKAELGRPLAKVVQIGTLSGYVKCANASIDIAGHAEEMDKINFALTSGFFYE